MPRTALAATAALAYVAAAAALGLTYLSVREVSIASNVRTTDPQRALDDLRLASRLDPLWAQPGRVAGTIALQTGRLGVAVRRFGQAAEREPGGWYAWFGKGLAEAALDELPAARRDLSRALAIETRQPVIRMALNGAETGHPLNPVRALYLIKATV